jgi:ATP-binding cassette, subfamily F, member 3
MSEPFIVRILFRVLFSIAFVYASSSRFALPKRWRISMSNVDTMTSDVPRQSTGVTFSGSSGAAVEISSVRLSIGNNDIMEDVNWTILPKERWALVGRNGAGKSTLLRAITGTGGELVSISEGGISIAKKARMGYLEQKGVSGSIMTVRREVSSRMDRLTAATVALEAAEKAVGTGDTSDQMLMELEQASVEFEAAGGYTVEQKIANVLKGLGFIEEDYDRYCAEFSGGWQMRIALARLLLSEPDLLLLDEPTNHLDKGARDWLGDYLSNYDGTLLVVSHDTILLQKAVSSIAEVRSGSVELYKSRSHDQWMVERDERVRQAQALWDGNQKEIARLQTFVDRFGTKTMGASMAQSRLKTIERLETNGIEAPKIGNGPMPVLKLPAPPRGSLQLLELKGCTLAWPAKPLGEGETVGDATDGAEAGGSSLLDAPRPPSILKDCNLVIRRGMRIVVRGPNGAGDPAIIRVFSYVHHPSVVFVSMTAAQLLHLIPCYSLICKARVLCSPLSQDDWFQQRAHVLRGTAWSWGFLPKILHRT